SPPEAPYAAPAASPRPLASLHPWQTTRRPSPCPSGPPLLVVASQPADVGAPPFGSGILTNSWAHIGLHPCPQLREPSTPPDAIKQQAQQEFRGQPGLDRVVAIVREAVEVTQGLPAFEEQFHLPTQTIRFHAPRGG